MKPVILAILLLWAGKVWQGGEVLEIVSPAGESRESHDPFITAPRQSQYPLASIEPARQRVYVIETGGHTYAAAGDVPGKKHYLAGLKPHDALRCFVKGRTLYVLDPRGKEHRLQIVQKK